MNANRIADQRVLTIQARNAQQECRSMLIELSRLYPLGNATLDGAIRAMRNLDSSMGQLATELPIEVSEKQMQSVR